MVTTFWWVFLVEDVFFQADTSGLGKYSTGGYMVGLGLYGYTSVEFHLHYPRKNINIVK